MSTELTNNDLEIYNIININKPNNFKYMRKKKFFLRRFRNCCLINIKLFGKLIWILIRILIILYLFFKNKFIRIKKDNYFACFLAMGKQENKYAKELIQYYWNLGIEKFILGDNNLPNTEKLSDVLQDYIDEGIIDIIELFDSSLGLSDFYNITYEKYRTKCKWFLLFDFDEYLEVHFEKNKNLVLKDFLSNDIFNKCESILFNWLTYSDNNLLHYDKRGVLERFTEPYFISKANIYVKCLVRGGINKTVFIAKNSNHVPERGVTICDSKCNIRPTYNPFTISPPIYDYGFIKHFSSKTAEEYCDKITRGHPTNVHLIPEERVKLFFKDNKNRKKKLNIFEKKFNKSFNPIANRESFRGNK